MKEIVKRLSVSWAHSLLKKKTKTWKMASWFEKRKTKSKWDEMICKFTNFHVHTIASSRSPLHKYCRSRNHCRRLRKTWQHIQSWAFQCIFRRFCLCFTSWIWRHPFSNVLDTICESTFDAELLLQTSPIQACYNIACSILCSRYSNS